MDTKNKIVKIVTNAIGTANMSIIEIRDIFKDPIKLNVTKIIIVHNHPSGDATPSKQDIEFTKRIKNAGEVFGIDLLDHIIIGRNEFKSLKRLGVIIN